MHLNLSHPSDDRLANTIISALRHNNIFTEESASLVKKLCKEVYDECEICCHPKRPCRRAKVALPRSLCFNDCVAVDIFEVNINNNSNNQKYLVNNNNKVMVLHMIDTYSRMSNAVVVESKAVTS